MYKNQQKQVTYSITDNTFLIKSRLHDLTENGQRFSKKRILEQIRYLDWIAEEL